MGIWGMSEDLGVEGGVVWLYMGICGYEEVLGGYIWVYVVIYGV